MNNQNQSNGDAMGLGIIMMMVGAAALIIYAIAAFLSIALSICCFFAWNKPLTFRDETLITPEEAHGFVGCGIVGAVIVPIFVLFTRTLLNMDFKVDGDLLGHCAMIGYILGSFLCLVAAHHQEEQEKAATNTPSHIANAPRQAVPYYGAEPQQPAFRYASWNDEEIEGQP